MKIKEVIRKIKKNCKQAKVYKDNFSNHTSIKIGGESYFVEPNNLGDIIKIIGYCKQDNIKYMIIGNGTNIVVSDKGYGGIVILLKKVFCNIEKDGDTLLCGAGVSLFRICDLAKDYGLSGLENLYGIPGSIGGAVYMNAGAYGASIGNVVKGVLYLKNDKVYYDKAKRLDLSYRHSIFMEQNDIIILRVDIQLVPLDKSIIKEKMFEILKKRYDSQPYNMPSAGSVFKRIDNVPVSKLIDQCGLKGASVGDCQVSTKHAGFIVNKGHATCKDFQELVKYIQKIVFEKHGIALQCEVIFIE